MCDSCIFITILFFTEQVKEVKKELQMIRIGGLDYYYKRAIEALLKREPPINDNNDNKQNQNQNELQSSLATENECRRNGNDQ